MKLTASFPSLVTDDLPTLRRLISDGFQRVARAFNNPDFGTTAARPTANLVTGQTYFDTTLNKPIWWNASIPHWVDATGANV